MDPQRWTPTSPAWSEALLLKARPRTADTCVPLPVTHIACLSPKETAVAKLKDAVVHARKQVFALHDELALSRNALAKHEQLCSEQQSMVAIKAQLLAERFKLVAGVSDEHRNLLRTEQELEMDEREHTSSFLAALTENEARIRALHRLATEDPENVAAALQAHMQAVSAELELAKRKVACLTIASMPRGTG